MLTILPLAQVFHYSNDFPWYAWVAIVAIVFGGLGGILKYLLTHRERMAMIRTGMHPDQSSSRSVSSVQKPHHPEGSEF